MPATILIIAKTRRRHHQLTSLIKLLWKLEMNIRATLCAILRSTTRYVITIGFQQYTVKLSMCEYTVCLRVFFITNLALAPFI